MKPYGSGSKKIDLKRRLYDSGVSYYPMPSVKRPIEINTGTKSFTAKLNACKFLNLNFTVNYNIIAKIGKNKDKSKFRFHQDMSADYGRDTRIPSIKHNQSFEIEQKDLSYLNMNNSMVSKAYEDTTPYGKFRFLNIFRRHFCPARKN